MIILLGVKHTLSASLASMKKNNIRESEREKKEKEAKRDKQIDR